MLSVICPIYNEEKYVDKCIKSILAQDYPQKDMEILFVDGMSTDATRAIISEYIGKYPFIRIIDNLERIVPVAMNIGIKASRGDIIMRIDAHTVYEPNYFSALHDYLCSHPDVDNVGAVCKTDVLNKTPKTLAIRAVLSNKFGVGNSIFRTGITKEQVVDTVPFGCWRKSVFEKYGLYDIRLVRNQDIELNSRIRNGGGKIVIIPDTYCTYLARESYKTLACQGYNNGYWNLLTVYYTGRVTSLAIRHYVPLVFVLSLIFPLLISLFWHPAIFMTVVALLIYLIVVGFISFRTSISNKGTNVFFLFGAFVSLHLSYGWGSLTGVIDIMTNKK